MKAELERARRFDTPIGIRESQKLQEAWGAGEIKVAGGDELEMRAAFDTLKAQLRRDATAELERPASGPAQTEGRRAAIASRSHPSDSS